MAESTRVVSYRYYFLEPTKNRTKCQHCLASKVDEGLYVIRLIWDNGDDSGWLFVCVGCYADIESNAITDEAKAGLPRSGLRMNRSQVISLVRWNEP